MSDITNIAFSLIKKGFESIDAAKQQSANVQGSIVFDKTHKIITVNGDIYGGNITDVNFDTTTNILTISKADGTSQTLDFSDTASATATLQVFKHQNDLMGVSTKDDNSTYLDYSDTNYIADKTSLVDADKALDSKIKEVVDDLEDDEKAIAESFKKTQDVIGTNDEFELTGLNQTGAIKDATTVVEALNALDDSLSSQKAEDISIEKPTAGWKTLSDTDTNVQDAVEKFDTAIDTNKTAIETLNGDATKDGSVAKSIKDAIEALDGTATIASEENGVVTIKAGVKEEDGVISNSDGDDITLAKVATTGAAEDVTVADANNRFTKETKNVETIFDEVGERLASLESLDTFDTVVSKDAATTPKDVEWKSGETTITGTLEASANTMHKIYLVPDTSSTKSGNYNEYITVKDVTGETATYAWELIGNTKVDLTGYVKTININGKDYAVNENTTKVELPSVITSVKASDTESAKETTGLNTDYIVTKVSTDDATATASEGSKTINVSTTSGVKVQDVATANDGTAEGSTKAMGLAEASNVKKFVEDTIDGLDAEVKSWEATATETSDPQYVTTRVKEENGVITEVENTTDILNTTTNVGKRLIIGDEICTTTKSADTVQGKIGVDGETKIFDVYELKKADGTANGNVYVPTGETLSENNIYTTESTSEVYVMTKVANAVYTDTISISGDDNHGLLNEEFVEDTNKVIAQLNKQIADAKKSANVVNNDATVTLNDTNSTTIATIGNTPITVKVAGYWSVWE